MLKDNLAMLRNMHGYSQEEIAGKIGISRQAYAKWESGATIPDVEKCSLLARAYGTTVDSLLVTKSVEGIGELPPGPIGKNIWGSVTVNDRGQIVIPKGARDHFDQMCIRDRHVPSPISIASAIPIVSCDNLRKCCST